MCGIVGLVGRTSFNISHVVREMASFISARGPDGEGFYFDDMVAMGMRRLSIIDLSHGWQPLYSRNGRVIAFQNGEIYNYLKIKEELERDGYLFKTSSDTEVLAHGYDAWGMEGLLKKIDGMYAIAIFDRDKKELLLARDRFGEKPLYYCHHEDWFAYSSDLRTLAALPGFSEAIDELSLERYLALHFVPGDRTIFKNINKVLPGGWFSIPLETPSKFRKGHYFKPEFEPVRAVSESSLAELIEQSVRSRLVADVPVGVFLSGGIDSSIVASIAASSSPGIATFSMGFSSAEHDESQYAKLVADSIKSTHHHFLFDSNHFVELLPLVASSLDEPIGDQATLPLFWLCREARNFVKVVLSGEGADEIFSGYGYYRPFAEETGIAALLKFFRHKVPVQVFHKLIENAQPVSPSGFPLLTDVAGRERLLGGGRQQSDSWESQILDWLSQTINPLQRASAADVFTWLPDDLLVKYDRMAMAHSLEGRAPFLMPGLVNAALCLPPRLRMRKNLSKVMLRRVAKRWLPSVILQRRKQGFVLPMRDWLRQWFSTHGDLSSYLSTYKIPALDMAEVANLINEDLSKGISRERFLFALVILFEWNHIALEKIRNLRKKYSKT